MDIQNVIMRGAEVTVQGIMVVFLILILIMFIIQAMALFSSDGKKKKDVPVAKVTEEPEIEENPSNEEELIAVLTAAVAACMGQSASSVNIKSYKKVSSAWGNAAKREILDNRF
jgi:sodium pump decarboxylase gamma subunit